MIITYDSRKNLRNMQERDLNFDQVLDLDWHSALVTVDNRKAYEETRYIASAMLNHRLHILVFCETLEGIRVISFRKANRREIASYEQQTTTY